MREWVKSNIAKVSYFETKISTNIVTRGLTA